MAEPLVYLDGIGWWSAGLPDWPSAARVLRDGDATPTAEAPARPAASSLPPNERRRAPESVLLACEVAAQACAMAGRDPATLACVFASAHGDIATTDALCAALARAPLETSPTRFHTSVHNAAAGYWTIATGCRASSSAIAAGEATFAAGLFEAAVEAAADGHPVLFAAYDVAAHGPLADVIGNRAALGLAFVIAPERSARTQAALRLRHEAAGAAPTPVPPRLAALAPGNLLAAALPLFAALAGGAHAAVRLAAGAASLLAIEVLP